MHLLTLFTLLSATAVLFVNAVPTLSVRADAISNATNPFVEILFPPIRTGPVNLSANTFCGGREPSTTRTPYPISQGKIWFNRLQDFDAIGITFSNSSKPKNASEIISFSVQASGHLNETTCYQTYDPSFLPSFIQPAKLGDNITIHMSSYHNGTTVEECSDVHLVSVEEYVPFNYTCPVVEAAKKSGSFRSIPTPGVPTGAINVLLAPLLLLVAALFF